jgi:hypothetical protein
MSESSLRLQSLQTRFKNIVDDFNYITGPYPDIRYNVTFTVNMLNKILENATENDISTHIHVLSCQILILEQGSRDVQNQQNLKNENDTHSHKNTSCSRDDNGEILYC